MNNAAIGKKYDILLPSKILFEFDERDSVLKLCLNEKYVLSNMQTDNAAFESWIFCLLPRMERFNWVELDWELPSGENGHYRRFLYRVIKMQEHFPWFRVAATKQPCIETFRDETYRADGQLFLNTPRKSKVQETELSSATPRPTEKSEAYYEQIFLTEGKLNHRYHLTTVNRQLPVGVFKDSKLKERVFTGGKSAIDLWGLGNDCLYFFELKFQNKMAGIITETLFYLWIMEDIMFTRRLRYPDSAGRNECRGFKALYDAIGKVKTINAVFLIDEIHPKIDSDVIGFINRHNTEKRLELQMCQYRPGTASVDFA